MEGGSATGSFQARRLQLEGQYRPNPAPESARPAAPALKLVARGKVVDAPIEQSLPAASFYARRGKRIFDLAASSGFLLLVGTWLFPAIAVAIRLNSKGPVFFRQKRVGLNGETFTCFKFRTMTHDPAARFEQARKDDCRITRVGAFLRRTNLDEVPQFINVLLGDMSVIGPRPHVPELDAMFVDVVPGYALRNAVKPGVSGLAQVSGCRGETRSIRDMTHRIRFDLFYRRNVSFWMDLKLVFLTVLRAVQGDERAY